MMIRSAPLGSLALGAFGLLCTVLGSAPALANDTQSEIAVGGLQFVKTDKIAIKREDLSLSPREVRVRYEMQNLSDQPITAHVAFPMPEVPMDTPGGMEIRLGDKTVASNIDLQPVTEPNFMNFEVEVDGKQIEPEVEIKAVLPDGKNIVNELRELGGWRLVLHPQDYENDPSPAKATIQDIGPVLAKKLLDLGAVSGDEKSGEVRWKPLITYHWQQTYKPGVTIVEHRYSPILGRFGISEQNGKWIGSDGGEDADKHFEETYCVDDKTKKFLGTLAHPGEYLAAQSLGYILTTGANWAGPIGIFHLTIDAETPPVQTPVKGISLCTDLHLHETKPLHWEATQENFTPTQELRVLMIRNKIS